MASLDGFGKFEAKGTIGGAPRPRQQARPARSETRPAPASSQQPVPGQRHGRDTEIWHLAKLFRQYAHADGIELTKGLPVIATEINDLVTRFGLRDHAPVHQMATGCARRKMHPGLAERCWYHYPPDKPAEQSDGLVSWDQLVEVIMAEFWSRAWDEHALDHFRQHFREYGRAAVTHWANLARARSAIARAAAAPRPPVMRRATMADATKEG